MKNLKFVVAIVGITVATFGNIVKTNAKPRPSAGDCLSYGFCGTTNEGATIEGQYYNN